MDKFRGLLSSSISQADIIILGLPFDNHASVGLGAKEAPDTLRRLSSYLPPLTKDGKSLVGFKIYDYGNLPSNDFQKITTQVRQLFQNDKFLLSFGGDHSYSIPLFQAFLDDCHQKGEIPVLIHLDAHPDICDSYLGSKISHACPVRRALDSGLDDENLIYLGLRGFEEEEVIYFNDHPNIKTWTSTQLLNSGLNDFKQHLKKYQDEKYAIYFSYDIDANDPSFAPGTGTPEAFGLPSTLTLDICLTLFQTLKIRAMDFMEISPPLDVNNMTSWLALKTIYEIFNVLKEQK